jgi:hypothetical protein
MCKTPIISNRGEGVFYAALQYALDVEAPCIDIKLLVEVSFLNVVEVEVVACIEGDSGLPSNHRIEIDDIPSIILDRHSKSEREDSREGGKNDSEFHRAEDLW